MSRARPNMVKDASFVALEGVLAGPHGLWGPIFGLKYLDNQ